MDKLTTPSNMDVDNEFSEDEGQNPEGTDDSNQEDNNSELSAEDRIWEADSIYDLDMDKLINGEAEADNNQEPNDELVPPKDEHISEGLVIKNPVLKFKGRDIPVASEEELINLAQKGLKLETEMGKIKPHKRLVDIIEAGKITEEDLVAFSDARNGNQGAIDYFKKMFGIVDVKNNDPYSFDFEEKTKAPETAYKPDVKASDPVKEWFDDYAHANPDVAGKVVKVTNEIDVSFFKEVYSPEIFPGFVQHVENGLFDSVYPFALKIKATNPALPWIVAYNKGIDAFNGTKAPAVQKKQPPVEASIPRNVQSQPSRKTESYDRVWDDDDYYKEIIRKIN